MQDAELHAFMDVFRELLSVFPKRVDEDEIGTLSRAYFTAMRRFSIPEIRAGAEAWTLHGKFFPKPAEWREAIPRRGAVDRTIVALSPAEAAEYLDAQRRGFEGEPCTCRRCKSAGVEHRFTRYAPETDEQGMDLRGRIGERTITRGQWLHGDDLARWYAARDAFLAEFARLLEQRKMPKVTSDQAAD